MSKFAIIENGDVINIVEASAKADVKPDDGRTVVEFADGAEIGGTHDGSKFAKIPQPAPPPVTAVWVKQEAYRRIVEIAPEWKQRNMTAQSVALLSKLQDGGTFTTDEKAAMVSNMAVWAQVKVIRAKSDLLEAMTPIPVDYTDDRYWS